MTGTTLAGGVAVLALLAFSGSLSFGLAGAVAGPIIGAALFFVAIRVFAYSGANDERDRHLVERSRFHSAPSERSERSRRTG